MTPPPAPTRGCPKCPLGRIKVSDWRRGTRSCPGCIAARIAAGGRANAYRHGTVVCQTCPAKISPSEVEKGLRRCKTCRQGTARTTVPRKADPPHTTSESVWLTADREDFTARMAQHFSIYKNAVNYYNAELGQRGAEHTLRRMRSGGV